MQENEKYKNLKLVPATESDREFFIHVHHTAYQPVVEEMFGWDESRQNFYTNKTFDDGGINIIWLEDRKIGVVGIEDRPEYLWLKEVFLLPEYQERGIGSQIVVGTIEKAKSAGKEIRLQTLKANLDAKRLYERHGFTVTEATDIHWKMSLTP